MFRRFLSSGLCLTVASTAFAAKPAEPRPVSGLRIGPETTIVTAPLNKFGSPDYVAALDNKLSLGVAPDENFWTAYCETLPRQGIGEGFFQKLITRPGFERACSIASEPYVVSGSNADAAHKQLDASMSRRWTRDELPLVAGWLDRNSVSLTRATEACARPKAYAPLITMADNDTMVAVLLPHVQQSRDTARAYSARAFLALSEGRGEDAWKDVVSLHRLAKHNKQSPFLIGNLVGIAISAIARIPTEAWLTDPATTPEVIARRWQELSSIVGEEHGLPQWLDGERFATLDIVLAIRSGRIDADSLLDPPATLSPAGGAVDDGPQIDFSKAHQAVRGMMLKIGDVNETLIFTNHYYDRVVAAFQEADYRDRLKAIEALDKEFQVSDGGLGVGSVTTAFFLGGPDAVERLAQRSFVNLFGAAFTQCAKADARTIARGRLLHAAFAAELHYRQTRNDITSSDELEQAVRRYAAAAGVTPPEMKDPYNGEAFRIVRDKDRLVIYAVGDNGESDGGKTFGDGEGCDDIVYVLTRGSTPPAAARRP